MPRVSIRFKFRILYCVIIICVYGPYRAFSLILKMYIAMLTAEQGVVYLNPTTHKLICAEYIMGVIYLNIK